MTESLGGKTLQLLFICFQQVFMTVFMTRAGCSLYYRLFILWVFVLVWEQYTAQKCWSCPEVDQCSIIDCFIIFAEGRFCPSYHM